MAQKYHLAQLNAAPLIAPMDDPQVAEFVNALDEINALAEQSEGFVWRLVGDGNNATDIRISDDPNLLVNMSVWENIESLYRYVYKSNHGAFFKRRRAWFTHWEKPSPVLWWIPAGHHPTLEEAVARVEYMAKHGATPYAFDFKTRFEAHEAESYQVVTD